MSAPLLSKIPGFDPRAVPAIGADAHLPAVPAHALQAHALRARFKAPPPWAPEIAGEPPMVDGPVRDAAVLVAIVMREHPMLLLTQRTSAMRSHAGQVAFAGGKVDASDADAVAAALREAHEEIGLHSDHVEVLGCLPSYTTGTAFRITPVVALVDASHVLSLSAGEVAEAFEVPLAFLMNPAHHLRHRVVWDFGQGPLAREWFSMPYPAVGVDTPTPSGQDRFIWGATAGMLRNLYAFLVVPQVG